MYEDVLMNAALSWSQVMAEWCLIDVMPLVAQLHENECMLYDVYSYFNQNRVKTKLFLSASFATELLGDWIAIIEGLEELSA